MAWPLPSDRIPSERHSVTASDLGFEDEQGGLPGPVGFVGQRDIRNRSPETSIWVALKVTPRPDRDSAVTGSSLRKYPVFMSMLARPPRWLICSPGCGFIHE